MKGKVLNFHSEGMYKFFQAFCGYIPFICFLWYVLFRMIISLLGKKTISSLCTTMFATFAFIFFALLVTLINKYYYLCPIWHIFFYWLITATVKVKISKRKIWKCNSYYGMEIAGFCLNWLLLRISTFSWNFFSYPCIFSYAKIFLYWLEEIFRQFKMIFIL